jgi:hypothetical protein
MVVKGVAVVPVLLCCALFDVLGSACTELSLQGHGSYMWTAYVRLQCKCPFSPLFGFVPLVTAGAGGVASPLGLLSE